MEIKELKLCKPLLISKNLFLEFRKMVKVETEILWNQIFSLVRNMARKTVGKLMDGISLWKSFFHFLKMKILENFTTSVIVKILWKQHHEKIDPCKKCRKKCSCGFVFQHLAKLRILLTIWPIIYQLTCRSYGAP